MLSHQEAENLCERLKELSCTNRKACNGLFGFVLRGEPQDQKSAYNYHIAECEYCRVALQLYRYKRDAARLVTKWEKAKEILAKAPTDPGILRRDLGNGTIAYFQPSSQPKRGTTVLVASSGEFLLVDEQSVEQFHGLQVS